MHSALTLCNASAQVLPMLIMSDFQAQAMELQDK